MNSAYEKFFDTLDGKKIDVVGIGVSNTPLIEMLLENGYSVTARDIRTASEMGETAERLEAKGATLHLGREYLQDLTSDIIFRTPGILTTVPEFAAARERGAVITSEMEVFFSLCPSKTICITGSDGKTTTSTIIAKLLEAAGKKVFLGGNIGNPLLTAIPEMGEDDFAVLELSSFQLHSMYCLPDVAVITNVSPNHLDVHSGMEDYVDAKRMIFMNQAPSQRLVVNYDNSYTRKFAGEAPGPVSFFSRESRITDGCYVEDGLIYSSTHEGTAEIMSTAEIALPGVHNIENYLAAFTAVRDYVPFDICRGVAKSFRGVSHRIEFLRELRGISFYNDSIASSPTRTIAGLRSFDKKCILIAGGYDKKIPFDELGTEITQRVKYLVLTGDTAEKISEAVTSDPGFDPQKLQIEVVDDFKEAVLTATAAANEGDVVLLSPACASFDKFANFAQRGDYFREIVMELE